MTNHEPIRTTNLDQYGNPPIPWSEVVSRLELGTASNQDNFTVLGTVTPDGRPHAAPVGALWIDGAWHVVTGPGTQKGRNLAINPSCTLSARLASVDVVFEGKAQRIADPEELERVAKVYRAGGWPAEVAGDAFTAPFTAPSGGPPPWHVYKIDCSQVFAVASGAELNGATKWTFG